MRREKGTFEEEKRLGAVLAHSPTQETSAEGLGPGGKQGSDQQWQEGVNFEKKKEPGKGVEGRSLLLVEKGGMEVLCGGTRKRRGAPGLMRE